MTDRDDFFPAYSPHKTQPYGHVEKKAVATTQQMHAVMTIPQLMSELIEVNITAWKSLPQSVRDLMLAKPTKFSLDSNEKAGSVPDIYYNGVVFKFIDSRWVLDDILE